MRYRILTLGAGLILALGTGCVSAPEPDETWFVDKAIVLAELRSQMCEADWNLIQFCRDSGPRNRWGGPDWQMFTLLRFKSRMIRSRWAGAAHQYNRQAGQVSEPFFVRTGLPWRVR